MLSKERVQEIIVEFGGDAKSSGKAEAQVALITERVKLLTEHLKVNKKDYHSRMGMYRMLGRRTKLLRYLKRSNLESYRNLIGKLGLKDRA